MVELLEGFVNRPMLETTTPLGGRKDWRSNLKSMPIPTSVSSNSVLTEALESLIQNGRINRNQALDINRVADLNSIFALANMVKQSRFDNQIFFNQNLHVNTTNICVLAC